MILDVIDGPFGKDGWSVFAERLRRAPGVILYHGTSSTLLPSILERGLLPRRLTGNNNYEGRRGFTGRSLESDQDLVYLIHRHRIGFGGNPAVTKHGGHLIGLRIFIHDTGLLVPDEDAKVVTWSKSVAREDSCAHQGPIPPQQLLGYVTRERNSLQYTKLQEDPADVVEFRP